MIKKVHSKYFFNNHGQNVFELSNVSTQVQLTTDKTERSV